MATEPVLVYNGNKKTAPNPYNKRWRWWYSSIADWMIANPGGKLKDCAAYLGKSPTTISFIANSDTFKDYYARRRQEWQESHDFAIRSRLTQATELGLDILIEQMTTKRSQIPMAPLSKMVESSLDRLGFAPKTTPQVAVQVNQDNRSVTIQGVSASDLSDARDRLRAVEQQKALQIESPLGGGNTEGQGGAEVESPDLSESVVEPEPEVEQEADHAPSLRD